MTVQHTLPVALLDGLTSGVVNPASVVVRKATGGRSARSLGDGFVLTEYRGSLVDLSEDTELLEDLRAFLRHVETNVHPFWLLEPFEFSHDEMFCGALADGSQTSFICPLYSASTIYSVLEDEVYTEAYTHHALSNVVANDSDSNAALTVGTVTNEGGSTVVTRKLGMGAAGRTCFKVVQAAAANNGLSLPSVTLSGSQLYRFRASVKGAGSFYLRTIQDDTSTTTDTSSPLVTGVPGGWVDIELDVTTEADTTAAEIQVYRSQATAATWFAGAIGAHPGGLADYFLPSSCPGVIEFDSAPAVNTRVLCGGSGQAMRKVAFDSSTVTWRLFDLGHAVPQQFKATEVMES